MRKQRPTERHGHTPEQRSRAWRPNAMSPIEALSLTALLGGGAHGLADGEEDVDVEDLVAALTLAPTLTLNSTPTRPRTCRNAVMNGPIDTVGPGWWLSGDRPELSWP